MNQNNGQVYDRDFFIRFFEAQDPATFCRMEFYTASGRKCSLQRVRDLDGNVDLLGEMGPAESAIQRMLGGRLCSLNNGENHWNTEDRGTPDGLERDRVLAALRALPDPVAPAESVTVTEYEPAQCVAALAEEVFA